jgi:hypothetical protein
MISLTVGDAKIDILPVVRGLSSYGDMVTKAFGKYDRYAVSLSSEEIIGVRNRKEIIDEYEPGELESVFAHRLAEFGEVIVPAPVWCNIVDLCDESSKELVALDMTDEHYTEIYCATVSSLEYVSEHRLAKKGMKRKFDMSTPETFSIEWDNYVNKKKGFRELSDIRERFISLRLSELSKAGGSILAVIDYERADNVAGLMR